MTKANKKSKGKRWKKGQSGSSNPEIKKYRQAAKNRFFQPTKNEGGGGLTVEAIEKHNVKHDDSSMVQDSDAATFKTWASSWTECTNTTFNKVHKIWNNDSVQREVLAVLAAVTDIIKTQGGEETELEYFAILMTTLEGTDDSQSLSAVVYLLSIVIKKIPHNILINKFNEVSAVLLRELEKSIEQPGSAITAKLISCLTSIFRVLDANSWKKDIATQTYTQLLKLSTNSKPKVRKAVRQAVTVILRTSECLADVDAHPVSSLTQKFCSNSIKSLLDFTMLQKSNNIAHCSDIIHILQLYRGIIQCFNKTCLKSACETLLQLMTLSNVMVKGVCLEVMNSLFHCSPSTTRLSPEMNARIITAMYDFIPNINDTQMMSAWLIVMENAHINLAKNDGSLCLSHLPRYLTTTCKCFLSDRIENIMAAAVSIKSIFMMGIKEIDSSLLTQQSQNTDSSLSKIFQILESTLSFQYHTAWGYTVQVITTAVETTGRAAPQLTCQLLPLLSDLRENSDFSFKPEVDSVIGAAVEHIGPRLVLKSIPLNISSNASDIQRSWLMPILHSRIQKTELSFFVEYFLPLADKCRDIANQQGESDNRTQQKVFEALVLQIWSLLPAFCNRPTDLLQSFKNIAKTLGKTISDKSDLRRYVFSALRKLINTSQDNESYQTELSRYSKNYLPILFNIYTSEDVSDSSELQVVLDVIRDFLTLTDQQLIVTFFDQCMTKLQTDSELSTQRRNSLFDLSISMVKYVDSNRLDQISEFIQPLLKGTDKTLEKKSYRFLENICSQQTDNTTQYVTEHMNELQTILLENLSTSSPSSKAPRLRCLLSLFKVLESANEDFLLAVLPEVILCVKTVNEGARRVAYDLIITLCECLIRWNDNSESVGVQSYINYLLAGLAGSPQMICCTVLALTKIILEYRQVINKDNLLILMKNTCLLLKSKSQEVITPTLTLLKVIIGSFDVDELASHLHSICDALTYMKEDRKHHFRFKVKEILERLVKKFGFEMIVKLLPNVYHKQLSNIKKTLEQKKRGERTTEDEIPEDEEETNLLKSVKKSQHESVNELLVDSDDEMVDDSARKNTKSERSSQRSGAPRGVPAWLRDDSEEITDLLDSTASRNIVTTRPTLHKPQKTGESAFKTAADGRMVITNLEGDKPSSSAARQAELEDIDDIFEQFEMEMGGKRKKKTLDMSESASMVSASSYKSGGKGIHRPLSKKGKNETPVNSGAEYKAKKSGGDVKKKNKLDPYAYIPLNMKQLNKRKQAKLKGQFKGFIGGAKKGVAKARKAGKIVKKK